MQDFFANAMDVALLCVYNNNWMTDSSNTIAFCREHIRRSELGYHLCEKCHKDLEKAAIKEGKPVVVNCHAGLIMFAIPVCIDGKYIASVIGGQVLKEPLDEKHFKNVAKKLNIKGSEYLEEIKNIKVLPEEKIKTATELLFLVTNAIISFAYARNHLIKLGMGDKIPRNPALEDWFLSTYGNIKRPISTREYEVLKLIVEGKSNTEIAKELFISVHTAKAHVSSILEKFEVEDRVQVAVKAIREGFI